MRAPVTPDLLVPFLKGHPGAPGGPEVRKGLLLIIGQVQPTLDYVPTIMDPKTELKISWPPEGPPAVTQAEISLGGSAVEVTFQVTDKAITAEEVFGYIWTKHLAQITREVTAYGLSLTTALNQPELTRLALQFELPSSVCDRLRAMSTPEWTQLRLDLQTQGRALKKKVQDELEKLFPPVNWSRSLSAQPTLETAESAPSSSPSSPSAETGETTGSSLPPSAPGSTPTTPPVQPGPA